MTTLKLNNNSFKKFLAMSLLLALLFISLAGNIYQFFNKKECEEISIVKEIRDTIYLEKTVVFDTIYPVLPQHAPQPTVNKNREGGEVPPAVVEDSALIDIMLMQLDLIKNEGEEEEEEDNDNDINAYSGIVEKDSVSISYDIGTSGELKYLLLSATYPVTRIIERVTYKAKEENAIFAEVNAVIGPQYVSPVSLGVAYSHKDYLLRYNYGLQHGEHSIGLGYKITTW